MGFHRVEGARAEIGGDPDGIDDMAKRLIERQPIAMVMAFNRPHAIALLLEIAHQGAADEA